MLLNMIYYNFCIHLQRTYTLYIMRIKEIIKEKGLSVSELANIMGIKQESLSRTINGNPTLDTLNKIADALKVPITDLFKTSTTQSDNDNCFRCPKCGTTLEIKEK